MATSQDTTSKSTAMDAGITYVFVNGEKCALLADYRLAVTQYFPEGTVILDPSYVPARRVPLGTGGDDLGVTRRKLLPYGYYEAYFEDKMTSELFPLTRGDFCCAYVTNLPLQATTRMLMQFFESFGVVQDVGIAPGRTTPGNGHGWVLLRNPKKLSLIPRVLEFFPKQFIYVELSNRHPVTGQPFGPLVGSSGAANGAATTAGKPATAGEGHFGPRAAPPPPPPAPPGPPGPPPRSGQWHPPAPASSSQAQVPPLQQPSHQRQGSTGTPHSPHSPVPLDGVPKPANPNLPQPRSSKLAAAAAASSGVSAPPGQGPTPPLPRGLAAASGFAPPPPPGAPQAAVVGGGGTPVPRSSLGQNGVGPANPNTTNGVDAMPHDLAEANVGRQPYSLASGGGQGRGGGAAVVPPAPRGIASPLGGSSPIALQGPSTVHLVTFIADADAPAAVRDGVFWPSPDVQQELQRAEDNGVTCAVIFFLLQSHPAVYGYGRLALPHHLSMMRNGLCRIEWVRHHLAIREHTLRNVNAHILLKLRDGAVVKPSIAQSACDVADTATPTAQNNGVPFHAGDGGAAIGTTGVRGRGAVGPPPPTGIYSPPAGSPVSPGPAGGGVGAAATGRGGRTAPGAVVGGGVAPATQRPQSLSDGPGPAIPIPASRRAQAAAAAAAAAAARGAPATNTTAKGVPPKGSSGDHNAVDGAASRRADGPPSAHSPAPAPVL